MIAQVENAIVPYKNIEIHEDNDEYSEKDEKDNNDSMQLYKYIGVIIYVVSHKVIENEIRHFGR